MERCFYCDRLVTRFERDHFPLARRHGGRITVIACYTCHDLKDRITIDNWPIEFLSKALQNWSRVPVEWRLWIAVSMSLFADQLDWSLGETGIASDEPRVQDRMPDERDTGPVSPSEAKKKDDPAKSEG